MYLNLPKYPRFLAAATGSAFMTTGIVFVMVQLVANDDSEFVEAPPYVKLETFKVREDIEPEIKIKKVEPPPEVEVEPTPPPKHNLTQETGPVEFAFNVPQKQTGLNIQRTALVDGEQIPIVKVAPVYPSRAAKNGIEGYVVLSFTITDTGATADATVLEAYPSGVFNRSALKAVSKFKYKPKVVDGQAQPVYDVQHRLTYELTNG